MGADFTFDRHGIVFIVSGPSGAGKSTLVEALTTRFPELDLSVSYTTRAPRGAEADGREYRFVDAVEFVRRRDAGEMAEWAEVHGALYGTPRAPLDDAIAEGRDLLLDIDVQGARRLKRVYRDSAVAVMVFPPSWEELERRLRDRRTDDEAAIARRLARAREEADHLPEYDYFVRNADREEAAARVIAIVLAERARVSRIVVEPAP
ncbi:MAG: guanylate kinase [Deltaproteobacteria bacterium]|nr:guanylate kinase [Deltaproteobacteria bacterium]